MGSLKEKENERKLSKSELKRKEIFDRQRKLLSERGYEEKDLTISLVLANVLAFVLGIPIIILIGMGFFAKNTEGYGSFDGGSFLICLAAFIAAIFVHELIHGVTWAIFTEKKWRAISFGFIVKYMTPYCTCSEALKKGQYIVGGVMPTVVLGIIPGIVSVFTGQFGLLVFSALMILTGGGDLAIILKLLCFRTGDKETLYIDHPYKGGLVAFIKN